MEMLGIDGAEEEFCWMSPEGLLVHHPISYNDQPDAAILHYEADQCTYPPVADGETEGER